MSGSDGGTAVTSPFVRMCERRFAVLAAAVLALAAFNLFFRLDREIVTEWDESLYATSAAETAANGNWIATTFQGTLDYYNTKPPLNVWLIAVSFRALGVGLFSLRLPSAAAAWLTVVVLLLWARRIFGAPTALLAALVLATTFGFLYVHSGRSANTDALFTLLMLLIVVTLWTAEQRPWRLLWLGPLLAAVFLLRGLAVLMPLVLVGSVMALGGIGLRDRWRPLTGAALLAIAPVTLWVAARFQVDQWRFLERMVHYDLVARSASALEGHTGTLLYYPNVLQKDQYDWLLACVAALILFPVPRAQLRQLPGRWRTDRYRTVVACSWVAVTLLIPTVMRTKLAWYLNPFFPIFALLVAAAIVHGLSTAHPLYARRRGILAGVVVLALAVAEAKLLWYSRNMRGLQLSAQGLILEEKGRLAGRRVYREHWPRNGRFVVEHLARADAVDLGDLQHFQFKAGPGDYLVLPKADAGRLGLPCVRSNERFTLCAHPEAPAPPPAGSSLPSR